MSASTFTLTSNSPQKESLSLKRKAIDTCSNPLDRQLKRLKDEILPATPYLLTLPTNVPYHLGNRIVNNWAVGEEGPFTEEEQKLQYLTFLTHQDDDSLLVAVGDWAEEHGSDMAENGHEFSNATGPSSISAKPSVKKKISLSDYKSKTKSVSLPSTNSEKDRGTLPKERTINSDYPVSKSRPLKHDGDSQNIARRQSPTPRTGPEHDRLGTTTQKSRSISKAEQPKNSLASSAKKRNTEVTNSKQDSSYKKVSNSALPTLLSPTLPPSSRSPKRLPALLSPTLPPGLEEELTKLGGVSPIDENFRNEINTSKSSLPVASPKQAEAKRPRSTSLRSTSSDQTSLPKKAHLKTSVSRDRLLNTSANDKRKDHPDPACGGISATSKPLSVNTQNSSLTNNTSKPPRLIVKLRYGRSNRKLVDALLKLSSKPRASVEPTDAIKSKGTAHHSSENDSDCHSSTRVPEKRPRNIDNDVESLHSYANKRPRTISSSDNPRTPTTLTAKSAGAKQNQTPSSKNPQATPGRDSQRNSHQPTYGDGEVRTPQALATKTIPISEDRNLKSSPPVNPDGSHNKGREKERKAWIAEFQRLVQLGRDLKHASERRTKSESAPDNIATVDEKLATATAVEAILCFILAFIIDDRSKAVVRQVGDSTNWRSILAYWRVVKTKAAPYPPLHGLCLLLGAISRDAIHALDLERLAICVVPDEHSPVPTPGSDGNTVTSEESKRQRKEFIDLKSRLPESYKEAHKLWIDGSRELSEDVLKKNFPETWSKRSRNFSEQGSDKLRIGNYSGDYFLPLGRTTTPLEAVRFGMSILKEWCKKEKIDYATRLWR